jgi:hypothetical protein
MTGWTMKAAKVVAMVGLLIAGVGVSAALADPGNGNGNGNGNDPSTVPGSPGDDCSHGNSGAACRPDPNQNGKDCEDHGNAKGNEDHCDTTTTTETTPTTETTTTVETTTTPETTTTTPGTTTNPGSSGGTPGNGGSPASSAGGSTPSSVSAPPISTPEQQQAPAQQVKGAQAAAPAANKAAGELPFTGFPAWALALLGSVMLAAGLGLRRVGSKVAS